MRWTKLALRTARSDSRASGLRATGPASRPPWTSRSSLRSWRTPPKPEDRIEGRDFRPYVVHLIGGKPTNRKYRRLLLVPDRIQDVAVERTSHHYSHERTCRFTAWLNDDGHYEDTDKISGKRTWVSNVPKFRGLFNSFVQDAESLRLALCKAIYEMLEADYWDRISDEQLLDFAEANDYTFEGSGHREG